MSDVLDDFAATKVPQNKTVSGLRLAMISGVMVLGLPVLVGGIQIGGAIGVARSAKVFLIGGLILAVVGTVIGIIGVKNRLSSYMLNKFVFGARVSTFLNVVMAVSVLCWYGISMDVLSATLQQLSLQSFGYSPQIWLIEVLAGILMTATAIWGFTLLNYLTSIVTPLLLLTIGYLGVKGYSSWDFDLARTIGELEEISDGDAVTATTGAFVVSVVLMSDFTRFAKTTRDALTASFLPFLLLATIGYLIATIAGISIQSSDLLTVLVGFGLGGTAFMLVILSVWTANVINLYSCSLSLASTITTLHKWQLAIIAGIIGTIAALANILEQFVPFLIILSICFAPIGGIYIVDFFLLRKRKAYCLEDLEKIPACRVDALMAWLLSIGAIFVLEYLQMSVSGFQVVDALSSAALFYSLLSWRSRDQ